jgi:hypothetical protein
MSRRYLFVGPSLPDAAERANGLGIVVLPPVSAGDLLQLDLRAGDAIGIVDGYFHGARAIPHKEIMAVLASGVRVLGAASMGALRAAELAPWGMRGVGEIYIAYRDGVLVADDEVALRHGPAEDGYRWLSEPLVNMRATLAAAAEVGRCSPVVADRLIERMGAIPYSERSYRRLAEHTRAVGLDAAAASRLVEYCLAYPVDRKRADAEVLLAALATAPGAESYHGVGPHRTIYLRRWQLEATADDLPAMRLCQVLAADYPELHRSTVLEALREDCGRSCRSSEPDPLRHGAHRGWYADDPQWSAVPFIDSWTTAAERAGLTGSELLTRFLVRSYRIAPGVADTERALAAFRAHAGYARALQLHQRVHEVNQLGREHRFDFDPTEIAADLVVAWLAARWAWPVEELELATLDRGFMSLGELLDVARQAFLAARCDPIARDFTLGDTAPEPGGSAAAGQGVVG